MVSTAAILGWVLCIFLAASVVPYVHANEYTELHMAVIQRSPVAVIGQLLKGEERSGINAMADNGMTPLHFAIHMGQWDVAELLLAEGANVTLAGLHGQNCLQACLTHTSPAAASLVLKMVPQLETVELANVKDIYGNTYLHLALMSRGSQALVESLLDRGVDATSVNGDGTTVLQKAVVAQDDIEVLKVVLEYLTPEDIDAADQLGQTAVHKALQLRKVEFARLLINHCADLDIEDKAQESPRILALKMLSEEEFRDVSLLQCIAYRKEPMPKSATKSSRKETNGQS